MRFFEEHGQCTYLCRYLNLEKSLLFNENVRWQLKATEVVLVVLLLLQMCIFSVGLGKFIKFSGSIGNSTSFGSPFNSQHTHYHYST